MIKISTVTILRNLRPWGIKKHSTLFMIQNNEISVNLEKKIWREGNYKGPISGEMKRIPNSHTQGGNLSSSKWQSPHNSKMFWKDPSDSLMEEIRQNWLLGIFFFKANLGLQPKNTYTCLVTGFFRWCKPFLCNYCFI